MATDISIARDFSVYPAGRKIADGPFTGEKFRDQLLVPRLRQDDHVTLDVDGVEGLPSSFWEEIFGGLIRAGWTLAQLRSKLTIKASQPELVVYPALAWKFASEAQHVQ